MSKKICVARVIDDFKIVLNVGSNDGIKEGDTFLVYSLDKEHIKDPLTGEDLGQLELIKGTGKITHVQSSISTLESNMYKKLKRKYIKSNPLLGLGNHIEEEFSEPEQEPFDSPKIGDLCKKI